MVVDDGTGVTLSPNPATASAVAVSPWPLRIDAFIAGLLAPALTLTPRQAVGVTGVSLGLGL